MATTPPAEMPPEPTYPGTPEAPPPEVGPNAPDIDVPAPQPATDPGTPPAQPTDLGDFA